MLGICDVAVSTSFVCVRDTHAPSRDSLNYHDSDRHFARRRAHRGAPHGPPQGVRSAVKSSLGEFEPTTWSRRVRTFRRCGPLPFLRGLFRFRGSNEDAVKQQEGDQLEVTQGLRPWVGYGICRGPAGIPPTAAPRRRVGPTRFPVPDHRASKAPHNARRPRTVTRTVRGLRGSVELPGIEPGSSGAESGLLRVQCVMALFSAPVLGRTRHRQAQSRKSPDRVT